MFKFLGCIIAIIIGVILVKYGLALAAAGLASIAIALGLKKGT